MTRSFRCYALHDADGTWMSVCLELSLSARAGSLHDAKKQLSAKMRAKLSRESAAGGAGRRLRQRYGPGRLARTLVCQLMCLVMPSTRARRYRVTLPADIAG